MKCKMDEGIEIMMILTLKIIGKVTSIAVLQQNNNIPLSYTNNNNN